MPAVLWKDVLCPGQCRSTERDWLTVSLSDTADAEKNARRALTRGVNVPGLWEHQDIEARNVPADPSRRAEWLRRFARSVFGHVVGVKRDTAGVLWLALEVRDPADIEQLAKTRFVSPKLYRGGYEDASGGRYSGMFVAHVAATPHPAQLQQRPFQVPDEGTERRELTAELVKLLRARGIRIPDGMRDVRDVVIALKTS